MANALKFFIPVILASVVLASIGISQISQETPKGYVIYRIDDIQSNWIPHVQVTVLNQFISHNTKASLAVIPIAINNKGLVFDKIKQGVKNKLFEVDVHGWKHVDYSFLSINDQYTTLNQSQKKLERLGFQPTVFIPPFNTFNSATIKIISLLGFKVISASQSREIETDGINDFTLKDMVPDNVLYHIPETVSYSDIPDGKNWIKKPVSEIVNHVDLDIQRYGYSVITLHPQNFALVQDGIITDRLDRKEMANLQSLMQKLHEKNIPSVTFDDLVRIIGQKNH